MTGIRSNNGAGTVRRGMKVLDPEWPIREADMSTGSAAGLT
jgi:hypothetical protein